MKSLRTFDFRHLRAAEGWLELGNYSEAGAELDNTSPELRSHPDVLEVRWQIYAKESKWALCLDIARSIIDQVPERSLAWIYLAHSTWRAPGGTVHMANDILLSVVKKFPKESLIPYNLACCSCQLGDLKEAHRWLERAFEIGEAAHLKLMALKDPDLEPLWGKL